jgi:hypothetical protein
MLRTFVAVGMVAVIAVVATGDALRRELSQANGRAAAVSGGTDAARLFPASGVLPGTLYLTTLGECRLQAIEMERLATSLDGPETTCSFSLAPDGRRAIIPFGPRRGPLGRSRAIGLAELGERSRLRRLAVARGGAASWSRDGARVAWCRDDGQTVVLTLATGERRKLRGCAPKFAGDSVLTRPDEPLTPVLLRDGQMLLDVTDVARGFPSGPPTPLDVLGYDAREDGLLAVVVVQFPSGRQPTPVLELWLGDELVRSFELPILGSPAGRGRFGERVEFSPDGRELLVAFPGAGVRFVLIDVASGAELLPATSQHGIAWSPDGAWFAVSTAEAIVIYGSARTAPAYVLPVGASALAWRPTPGASTEGSDESAPEDDE